MAHDGMHIERYPVDAAVRLSGAPDRFLDYGSVSNVFEQDRWYLRPRVRSGSPQSGEYHPDFVGRPCEGIA